MKKRTTFRIVLFSLLGFILILMVASVYLTRLVRQKIDAELVAAGITIRNIDINLLTQSVTLYDIEWNSALADNPADSSNSSSSVIISAQTVRAYGIDVLSLIKDKRIKMLSLRIHDGKLLLKLPPETTKKRELSKTPHNVPFESVHLSEVDLEDIQILVQRDTLIEHEAFVKLSMKDVNLRNLREFQDPHAYSLGELMVHIEKYRMASKKSMYTLDVSRINFNGETGDLSIDSTVLLPKYGKYAFSRKLGKQFDRFVLRIPQITINGIDQKKFQDSMFVASKVLVNRANLYVFRDKRLPFIKTKHTPLPVALIRSLPFGFAIDSLILAHTRITYEEFPEEGFKTGYIVFKELNAQLPKLSNRSAYPGVNQTVLHVESKVMDYGLIKVDFTLPYDKAQVYNAKGRISNLRMSSLNPLLESLAFVRVESGRLNALDFDFDYDDYTSRGDILINYENLKITGLKKEPGTEESGLKSLALNIFVKKDKDRDVPTEKRRGKVFYERDRRRAVFNVWVKSLMSGVKSSVIDSPSEKKPLTKKQRRDSLRDVRKEQKKLKKKEKEQLKEEKQMNEKSDNKKDSIQAVSSSY